MTVVAKIGWVRLKNVFPPPQKMLYVQYNVFYTWLKQFLCVCFHYNFKLLTATKLPAIYNL